MSKDFHCLAIETATSQCSVALTNGNEVWVNAFSDGRGSSRKIYSAINALLERADMSLQQLDCIAFGCGPGSFTGVRVAASVAQGIGYACELPVCRVSTLAAIAQGAARIGPGMRIAACLDARMGEAYVGVYDILPDGVPADRLTDQLVDPLQFRLAGEHAPMLGAGPGWAAWPALIDANRAMLNAVEADVWPLASDILVIAGWQFAAGQTVSPVDAIPNYVRMDVTQ